MAQPLNFYTLTKSMADIGAASGVRFLVPAPGFLRRVDCTIAAALTGADAVITVQRNNSSLSPTFTVPFTGSAEGQYNSQEFYQGVAAGDWIEVNSDGGPTNSVAAEINLVLSK